MSLICDSTTPYYADFLAVSEQLYCPVCAGQNLLSSQARFAVLVRDDICTLLHEGMPNPEIIRTLEQRYGTHLRYSTPAHSEMLPLMSMIGLMVIIALWYVRKFIMLHRND
jgi:cytochrome c-type biogenesis protein CcmH/NrfF